jgi:hypothetical protein
MKSVWKYKLNPRMNEIEMPINSTVLTVQVQDQEEESVSLWILTDSKDVITEKRRFLAIPTGDWFTEIIIGYVGTILFVSKRLVFHVFEVK